MKMKKRKKKKKDRIIREKAKNLKDPRKMFLRNTKMKKQIT
jgi:hypothetical protein